MTSPEALWDLQSSDENSITFHKFCYSQRQRVGSHHLENCSPHERAEILPCITCHSPAPSLQWLPISLWRKSRVLTMTFTVPQDLPPPSLRPHLLIPSPVFYSLKPHWPPCCSSSMLLPQDVCTCYSSCLKCSALRSRHGFILYFLRSLLNVTCLGKPSLGIL